MNSLILDFLDSYAGNPNPQYAVMLKGKWGCGKTHLIKQWKKKFDKTSDTNEEITLKPIYISTYGMDSVNDIKTAIDRELNPFFYSKTGRFIKGALKLAGKIVFKQVWILMKILKRMVHFPQHWIHCRYYKWKTIV